MAFTVESKSQLAKLLATENLTIEHQKIRTAMFDPKNRVLYCPIWKDMTGATYDHMLGHEVGHALYTPAEGWHEAASSLGAKYKGFLNVVEDARIEKKVKRKYPGIRSSFVKSYQALFEQNFFGVKGRDLNSLSFIDRLNLHTKSSGTTKVDFTDEEMKLVKQVEACETWEDVVRVTKAVFNYSKEEQFEMLQQLLSSMDYQKDDEADESGDNGYEYSDYDEEEGEEEQEASQSGDMKGESGSEKQEAKKSNSQNDDGEETNSDENGNSINHEKESKPTDIDQFEPSCQTDENFRKNEDNLVSQECKPYVYAKIPKANLENIVTPAKRVHQLLEKYYFNHSGAPERSARFESYASSKVKEFKSKNERYVSLLAKEFEMKKAARAYAKAKVSNTGDIDISKLYKYQVEDNIFRKMMRVPKGKSHGLVLLLDRSGSMSRNMAGSIEQILVLAMFCRKVNIPFVLYGFGDVTESRAVDYPGYDIKKNACFQQNVNEFSFDTVFLREYINSKMSNSEFNRCIRNLVLLKESYTSGYHSLGRPMSEHLGNTPLLQAMIALEPITKQFRKVNNLDLVNLVVVHDGDADNTSRVNVERDPHEWEKQGEKIIRPTSFNSSRENVFIKDYESKLQVKIEPSILNGFYDESFRIAIFDWFRAKTGAKIFGFFIAGQSRELRQALVHRYVNKDGKSISEILKEKYSSTHMMILPERSDIIKDIVAKMKSEKFIQSYNKGYEAFFIMPGGSDLQIEDEELVVTGAVTANKLKTAFMRMNKKKAVNRVMVSRFIDGIAA